MSENLSKQVTFFRQYHWRRIVTYTFLVAGVLLLGLGIAAWFRHPKQEQYTLRITAGSRVATRTRIAEFLAKKSPGLGLHFEIQSTEGSLTALNQIESGECDLAIVEGAIQLPEDTKVRQVASLDWEALHLLVKAEFAKDLEEDLKHLRGKKINVSQPGSGTYTFASRVLDFIGLKPTSEQGEEGYTLATLGYAEILHRLKRLERANEEESKVLRNALPDAFFLVGMLPSPIAMRLVKVADYQLVPLKFGRAFSMISLREEVADSDHINQHHVHTMEIPEFTYSVTPPVPAEPCSTLGVRTLLVASADVDPEVIERILPLIYSGPVEHLYRPDPLKDMVEEYPLHEGAILYRDRDQPLVRSDVVAYLQRAASIFGPILGGVIALYGYYRWRHLLRFDGHFQRAVHLDLVARGIQEDPNIPQAGPERITYLENELGHLQKRAVSDFCRNYFYGDGVLFNLLVLIGETHQYLRTMETNDK